MGRGKKYQPEQGCESAPSDRGDEGGEEGADAAAANIGARGTY